MAPFSEFAEGTIPHMFLYNSDNTHYDLLVEDNSRLAVLGLISMEDNIMEEKKEMVKDMEEKDVQVKEVQDKVVEDDKAHDQEARNQEVDTNKANKWKTVQGVKSVRKNVSPVKDTITCSDSEESLLNKHKQNGHNRDGPQSAAVVKTKDIITVNLEKDMQKLKVSQTFCEQCHIDLATNVDFLKHNKIEHSKQWNCDLCDFQASTRQVLLKHCKLTPGHLPSQQKLGQTGVLECYTCKHEFRNYHDLMNHRKEEHPSHKKCRYFIKGECNFSAEDCWYLHEVTQKKVTTPGQAKQNIQCFICKNRFESKYDLVEHKKKHHPTPTVNSGKKVPTQNAWAKPLSNMQEKDFCQLPLQEAPDQGALVTAIQILTQRLLAMENRMFPELK